MSNERIEQALSNSASTRREFLGGTFSVMAAGPLLGAMAGLAAADEAKPQRKIKIGLVGCGGRGSWICQYFLEHGGYEFVSVADYFSDVAEARGNALGVDKSRCFSGLSGYQKVIDSGIEAVVLQTPPGFLPEHAAAAVDAGLHVYMAKPVAVDVPGCLTIEALGPKATEKQRVFFVDYQMPTDPANRAVAERIWSGEMGKIAKVSTVGVCGGHDDPPKTATIASRLRDNVWDNDIAIGNDYIGVFDIHALDAALWILKQRPVSAMGLSRIGRKDPHGDAHDIVSLVYEYADGLVHEHSGIGLPNSFDGALDCRILSATGHALIPYWGNAHFHVRKQKEFTQEVVDLYPNGAKRNIATFHEAVMNGQFDNPTVRRAVDGCLTCILGREAGQRGCRVTMEEIIKENKRVAMDLTGLDA